MRSSIPIFVNTLFTVVLGASVTTGTLTFPSPAIARSLANSLELGVQPGFAVWGEDEFDDVIDEYSTNIRIGYFFTDSHEVTFSIDLSDTEACLGNCFYSDYEVYMFNYLYNFSRWESVVPYVGAGVGIFYNYTGCCSDDDGLAINLGGGVRWFPSRYPFYVGLDIRVLGFSGDMNDTVNGIAGLALGTTVNLKKLFGR